MLVTKNWLLTLWSVAWVLFGFTSCQSLSDESADLNEWTLVWSDEFDQEGLPDSEKWVYVEGDGCPDLCGWGNNELQYYMAHSLDHTRVKDGVLTVEAHQNAEHNYSSAKLVSKPSGVWKYCKVEVKAKLPYGRGVWPAIWMLPVEDSYGGWPRSGEIDIMEYVGYEPDTIYSALHTEHYNHIKGTEKVGQIYHKSPYEDFNTYSMIWQEDDISFFINDRPYHKFVKPSDDRNEWPFDHPFYLVLNLAVGGNWGGMKGVDPDIWPQRFEIEYVRVYQQM